MKLMYDGKEVGQITTNRSLTVEEALWSLGYDVHDQVDMEQAYRDGFPAAYVNNDGEYAIDVDGIEMQY